MICTKIVAWKGIHGGRPMLRKSYDATNAFACGSKLELEECARQRLHDDGEIEDEHTHSCLGHCTGHF